MADHEWWSPHMSATIGKRWWECSRCGVGQSGGMHRSPMKAGCVEDDIIEDWARSN